MLENERPERNQRGLSHIPPHWVPNHETFFITICAEKRGVDSLTSKTSDMINCLKFYQDRKSWTVELFLVMPDHAHLLVSFNDKPMNLIIASWKRYTARQFGLIWQRDYFDHRCRNERDHSEKWAYIRDNPVKAGLVESYDQWPHLWRLPDQRGW